MKAPNVMKFGIIGTSCAGKTTLAHALVSRLKSYSILADGLFSQDRKFSFDRKYLPTEAAQNMMITNLISKEVDLSLHGDVEVLITDRTPIDLFAYYAHQYDTPLSRACWAYAKEWAKTYTQLYYLAPLPFQDDGKRPADDFRLQVDEKLKELIQEVPNVVEIGRHDVLNSILNHIGFDKPSVKMTLEDTDAQTISDQLNKIVIVKEGGNKDVVSDYDMWIVDPLSIKSGGNAFLMSLDFYKVYIHNLLGQFVPVEVNIAGSTDTFDFPFRMFVPQV